MVFREENKVNYTKISNELFKDKELSLSAKGLLIIMLSLPDNWNYSTLGLASIVKESKNTIHRLLKELEDHKYLIRKSIRDDKGKFIRFDYFIYELPYEPYPNIRDMELPDMDYCDNINKINNKDKYDKTPLSGFTNELIRRNFITKNDFDINRYEELFNELNKVYDYELIYICSNYIIKKIKYSNNKDSNNENIDDLFNYFKKSLIHNLEYLSNNNPLWDFED